MPPKGPGHVRQAGGDSRLKLRRCGCSGVGGKWSTVGGWQGRDRRHGGSCCGRSAAIKPCAFGAPLRGCGAWQRHTGRAFGIHAVRRRS